MDTGEGGGISHGGRGDKLGQWLWLLGAIMIAALALRRPLLALLALTLALAIGVALLWRRYGLRAVHYQRAFSQTRVFPDEEFTLELVVDNAKPLPLPWLEIEDEFPSELQYQQMKLDLSPKPKVSVFKTLFSLRPYERVRRRYRVVASRRGYHRFGPAEIRTGDPFGFVSAHEEVDRTDYLIVYPRVLPVSAFNLPLKQPFGDGKPVRPLMEDPLRFSGVRPYEPGDLPRRIHWRATARSGQLQSKQFEPSALPVVALFLDVNTFEHFWQGLDPERLERAISATASLAAFALEERRQVGLYANAPLYHGQRFIHIAPGRHPAQLARILEALALLIPHTGDRIETLLAREAPRLPWGATLVVVTGYVTPGLEETLAALYRAGHAIVLVSFAEHAPDLPSRPGFRVHQVDEEVASGQQLAQLALA